MYSHSLIRRDDSPLAEKILFYQVNRQPCSSPSSSYQYSLMLEKSISSALRWWAASSSHSWEYHWWQKRKLWRGAEGRIPKCFPFSVMLTKSPWTRQSKEVPLSSGVKRETLGTPLRDMWSSCQADQIKGGPGDAQSHEEKLRD